jgi:diguanylate cyclase
MRDLLDFSPRGWGRVIGLTVLGTLLCIALAIYVDSFGFAAMTDAQRSRALLTDIFLPILIAAPMLAFLAIRLRRLAIRQHDLARLAATDSLTQLLNRGAFVAAVEAWLAGRRRRQAQVPGALLLIDADNFKAVNDAVGHDGGDEALRNIAATIRSSVRTGDLVARIGGEEFAVFLPGSTAEQAAGVARRICTSIASSGFVVHGAPRTLTVSVGGAYFERRLAFADLFRLADQQLYAAKRNGRNQVSVAPVIHDQSGPATPARAA